MTGSRHHGRPVAADVEPLFWPAEQLGIGMLLTAHRLAATGELPGAFRVGGQVSTITFVRTVHGDRDGEDGEKETLVP